MIPNIPFKYILTEFTDCYADLQAGRVAASRLGAKRWRAPAAECFGQLISVRRSYGTCYTHPLSNRTRSDLYEELEGSGEGSSHDQ